MQGRTAPFRPGLSQVIEAHVCVRVCVRVCVYELAHTYQLSTIGPMYCPTRHQVGVRWRALMTTRLLARRMRLCAAAGLDPLSWRIGSAVAALWRCGCGCQQEREAACVQRYTLSVGLAYVGC